MRKLSRTGAASNNDLDEKREGQRRGGKNPFIFKALYIGGIYTMKKVGFTASSFDLLHAGHVLMLEDCKKHCDYLIVGLNASPQNKKCVQSLYERWVQINSVKYVDEVVVYDSEADLINILKSRKIDVRFLGEDYRGKAFTGSDLNIPIHYNPRRHDFSTTELKERIRKSESKGVTDETKRE